jgi:hypothetical protein
MIIKAVQSLGTCSGWTELRARSSLVDELPNTGFGGGGVGELQRDIRLTIPCKPVVRALLYSVTVITTRVCEYSPKLCQDFFGSFVLTESLPESQKHAKSDTVITGHGFYSCYNHCNSAL